GRRLLRNHRCETPVAAVLDVAIVVGGQLVLLRHLPGKPEHPAVDMAVVAALLVRIELRITARYGLVDAPVAEREVEPHLVAFERTANRRVEVPDALDL